MHTARKNASRGRAPARPSVADINRFEPMTPVARRKVEDLVARGAVITRVRSSQVTLKRGEQTAFIDAWGRVDWAH